MPLEYNAPSPEAHNLPRHLEFTGKGWNLFKLQIVNYLLTLVTFGIYFFWARVRYHRFFYYHTIFHNGNFDFHATGKELFVLFLKSMGLTLGGVALLGGCGYLLMKAGASVLLLAILFGILVNLLILGLIPLAVHETRKFMMARTSWNLSYFSFIGPIKELYRIYFQGFFLSLITFGIYSFWFRVKLKKYLTGYTVFDNRSFSYRGKGKEIFFIFLPATILIPITLGLYAFWLIARLDRYNWSHTYFDNRRFESTMTGGGLLKVTLIGSLLTIFTAGIGLPWALVRLKKYKLGSIGLTNEIVPEPEATPVELRIKTKAQAESSSFHKNQAEKNKEVTSEDSPGEQKVYTQEFREKYGDFFEF